jgi:hypothetical protein
MDKPTNDDGSVLTKQKILSEVMKRKIDSAKYGYPSNWDNCKFSFHNELAFR